MKKKNSGKAGFTLIELLISLVIVGFITTLALANFRATQRSEELRLAAETLASDIRRAQTMSLVGARLSDGRIARGGYGIFFQTPANQYILFAEEPFSGTPPPLSQVNGRRDGTIVTNYQDVSTVNLSSQITVSILEGVAPSSIRYVSFAPPRPIVCFATDNTLGITTATVGSPLETIFTCAGVQPDSITIELSKTGVPGQRTITVGRSGQISVE